MAEEMLKRSQRNFSDDEELADVRAAMADSRQPLDVQGETVSLNIEPTIGDIDELGFDDLLEASLRHAETQTSAPEDDFEFDPGVFAQDDQAAPLPAQDEQSSPEAGAGQAAPLLAASAEEDPFLFKGLDDLDDGNDPQQGVPQNSQKLTPEVTGPEFEDELADALKDARQQQPSQQGAPEAQPDMVPGGHAIPTGHDAGRVEVGILQGMSYLGGAGLAALAHLIRHGGAAANSAVQQHRYNKITSEVNSRTQEIEDVVGMLNGKGLSAGLHGLKGEHRDEFVQEFLDEPGNRDLFNKLLTSVGALSTSTSKAAVVGSGAGLSPEQIENDIQNRINDVRDRHKEVLEALKDPSGKSVADRLSGVINQFADLIKSIFRRATQAMGIGPRPGM